MTTSIAIRSSGCRISCGHVTAGARRWLPHHNVDAYRRSDFLECCEIFQAELEHTKHARFRSRDDWQRALVLYYALARGRASLRKVTRFNKLHSPLRLLRAAFGSGCGSDSRCIPAYLPNLESIMKKYSPSLFCLNDDARMTDEDRTRVRAFLKTRFPEKSSFEK